jgi:FkbM family methyltransferase
MSSPRGEEPLPHRYPRRVLDRLLYPLFRRVEFRGKGRLRRVLPVRARGSTIATFPGGVRLRLDLRESLQRDFLFGMFDRRELALVREHLRGGDFVDVGAHIGLYTLTAARAGARKVVAFEPNPSARAQLEENIRLNGVDNVIVSARAVGAGRARAVLHVPATPDPSFSSLAAGRFEEGAPVEVDVTTLDSEVDELELAPTVVKVDVEGRELEVVDGMERTLAIHRPVLLVEVSEESAAELARRLEGYSGFRVARGALEPLASGRGLFNALFVPQPPV